jgi:membrane fusion protein (multidrug efflux system)
VEPHRCGGKFKRLLQGVIVSTIEHAKPSAMIKPLVILVLVAALILGGIFGWGAFKGKMMAKYMAMAATAPQTVSTTKAASLSWQAQTQSVGSLRAVRGADLSLQIAGIVDEIRFESGSEVPAGAVLLKLRPYDDTAKLEQLEAAAVLAEQTYKRDQEQFTAQAGHGCVHAEIGQGAGARAAGADR